MKTLYLFFALTLLCSACQPKKEEFPIANQEEIILQKNYKLPTESTITNTSKNYKAPIFPKLEGEELREKLKQSFQLEKQHSYKEARAFLYSEAAVDNGKLTCIYTGYQVDIDPKQPEIVSWVFREGINCEHIYPQSKGARKGVAKTDLFHLYPSLIDVNSARSSLPFHDIPDPETEEWFYLDEEQESIPTKDIDNWSEVDDSAFEPRENVKGDVARSVFYFVTMYSDNPGFDAHFFEGMKEDLLQWHRQDPVDDLELQRNTKIKSFQGNENPYILEEKLASRVFQD